MAAPSATAHLSPRLTEPQARMLRIAASRDVGSYGVGKGESRTAKSLAKLKLGTYSATGDLYPLSPATFRVNKAGRELAGTLTNRRNQR